MVAAVEREHIAALIKERNIGLPHKLNVNAKISKI
jgi:hypothetical protein